MTQFKDAGVEAAEAGAEILRAMRGKIHPREKAPKDLVTEADFASQAAIRDALAKYFPGHGFLGEEMAADAEPETVAGAPADSDYCWIVDPLDGTLNYTRQLPNYSVSIALRHQDRIVCGVVYDPVLNECFAAELGLGATLNGQPIATSRCQQVERALVAASLPAEIPRGSLEVQRFLEVMYQAQAIRRLGSAALNLCYLAMGRLDAYWATCVKIWDIAAGQLIATEAGAIVTRPDGSPFDLDRPQFVAAAQPSLHAELVEVLQRAGRDRANQQ